ncbi:hypothetical protein GCM10022199_17260 [Marihabitans asiaticum]|nr:MFS transporter [Marihabitans asiaticum]
MNTAPAPAARSTGEDKAPFRLVVILAVLGMFGPFSIDTAFPAFARMGEDLSSSPAAMQQVVSVYMLAFASMSLFHGPLSDALGRKPVMIAGSLGYVLASAVCALAPTLPLVLTGRALQGFTAGAATIVSRAVVRDLYDGPAAQRLMSAIAMVFAIGPGVAPVFGGWLLLTGTWRSIFWALSIYGLVVAVSSRSPFRSPSHSMSVVRSDPDPSSATS